MIVNSTSSRYAETIYTNFHITKLVFQKFILHKKEQSLYQRVARQFITLFYSNKA